jgi:hypothetical protein
MNTNDGSSISSRGLHSCSFVSIRGFILSSLLGILASLALIIMLLPYYGGVAQKVAAARNVRSLWLRNEEF